LNVFGWPHALRASLGLSTCHLGLRCSSRSVASLRSPGMREWYPRLRHGQCEIRRHSVLHIPYRYLGRPVPETRCSLARTVTMTTSDPLEARPVTPLPTRPEPSAGHQSFPAAPVSTAEWGYRFTGYAWPATTGTLVTADQRRHWLPNARGKRATAPTVKPADESTSHSNQPEAGGSSPVDPAHHMLRSPRLLPPRHRPKAVQPPAEGPRPRRIVI
jgi:hypothetical protein